MNYSFLIALIGNDICMRRKVGSYVILCLNIASVHQINNFVDNEQDKEVKKNKNQKW